MSIETSSAPLFPRISLDRLARLNELLTQFEGTHFFHNFTDRRGFAGKSFAALQRFVKRFRVEEVFVYQGEEFLRLEVTGQSFVYNQIRKMVAFAILAFRQSDGLCNSRKLGGLKKFEWLRQSSEGLTSVTSVDQLVPGLKKPEWLSDQLVSGYNCKNGLEPLLVKGVACFVPNAPALGLFLDNATFVLNKPGGKVGMINDALQRRIFIEERIIPEICGKELALNVFANWLTNSDSK